jgi:hypothetical protein
MAQIQKAPSIPNTPKLVTREGLRKFTGDVVGFHDLETQGHIYGIPRAAKLMDQKDSNPPKPSCFVIFELLEDCKATEGAGDEAVEVNAKVGDMVGVWLKGGMRGIKNLCGVPTLMQHTGEKRLKGKPASFSPMKTYQFDIGKGTGTLIPVIEDTRKDSRNQPYFLLPQKSGTTQRQPGDDTEDDLQF